MTNYEKIKAMSVEEMAEFIHGLFGWEGSCGFCKTCDNDCIGGMKKWLESEVEEDG